MLQGWGLGEGAGGSAGVWLLWKCAAELAWVRMGDCAGERDHMEGLCKAIDGGSQEKQVGTERIDRVRLLSSRMREQELCNRGLVD